jgi:hypothetical protein
MWVLKGFQNLNKEAKRVHFMATTKGKVVPVSSTSALDGGKWLNSSPGRYNTQGSIYPCSLDKRPCGPQSKSGYLAKKNLFPLPGTEPQPSSPSICRPSYLGWYFMVSTILKIGYSHGNYLLKPWTSNGMSQFTTLLICGGHTFGALIIVPTAMVKLLTNAECWRAFHFHCTSQISGKHEACQHFVAFQHNLFKNFPAFVSASLTAFEPMGK